MSSTDLQPSKLGTKEHWDLVYSSELANFEDIGDEGEVWFGEDSVEKMVDWALENIPMDPPPFILESMCGVDYSADAIKLAQAIAKSKSSLQESDDEVKESEPVLKGADEITFAVCNFLKDDVVPLQGSNVENDAVSVWDLVLDKGTFDAMSLADKDVSRQAPADRYPIRIARVVKPGGFFLITSCNFTEEELKAKFGHETGLQYHSRIPWPTFAFGGKKGNVYSSVAFRKP